MEFNISDLEMLIFFITSISIGFILGFIIGVSVAKKNNL